MLLLFGDEKVRPQVQQETPVVSRHTGKELAILKAIITVRGADENQELLALVTEAKKTGIVSTDEGGSEKKKWTLGNTSWRFQEGHPIYTHTLELKELEELEVTSLSLGDLHLTPYEYREQFDDDKLVIETKVSLSEEQHLKLKALLGEQEDLSVVRHGISDEPRVMVAGLTYWSQHESQYKHDSPERSGSLAKEVRPEHGQGRCL